MVILAGFSPSSLFIAKVFSRIVMKKHKKEEEEESKRWS